jgi:DNA polymerase III delta subunit
MITIIHGSNQVGKRGQLQIIKQQFGEVITYDGKDLDLNTLLHGLELVSMFGDRRLILIENYFFGKKNRENIIKLLLTRNFQTDIVFWEDRESKSKDLTLLAVKAKVIKININTIMFKLFDNLFPENGRNFIHLLDQVFQEEDVEMVLFMFIRQLRFLILSTTNSQSNPTDFARLQSWQYAKLTKTAQLFKLDRLLEFYRLILELDYKIKTGMRFANLQNDIKFMSLKLLAN